MAASNRLTGSWARVQPPGNTVFSGPGCWVLLSLLASGASGAARRELEAAIGLAAEHGLVGARTLVQLLGACEPMHAALGIWSREVLDPDWVQGLPDGTTVGQLSGGDQGRIDRWVGEATKGHITQLPIAITEATAMLLVSALALEIEWHEPFRESGTFRQGAWVAEEVLRLTGSTGDLDRLRVADTEVGPLTVLDVPAFGGVDVHLVRSEAHVPAGAALAAGVGALAASAWVAGAELEDGEPAPGVVARTIESHDPEDRLDIDTPAFEIRASHDLLQFKRLFGLEAATAPGSGHFPGISPSDLNVGQAKQDAVASFTATGFRAAAVTAVEMLVTGARPELDRSHRVRRLSVSFDGPFGFIVTHRSSSLVLFAGWVHDPSRASEPMPRG